MGTKKPHEQKFIHLTQCGLFLLFPHRHNPNSACTYDCSQVQTLPIVVPIQFGKLTVEHISTSFSCFLIGYSCLGRMSRKNLVWLSPNCPLEIRAHSQSASLLAHVRLSPYVTASKKTPLQASLLGVFSSRCRTDSMLQHIFNKNSIPLGRVIYQHMGYRTDNLSILDNWTAAHSLYNTACDCQ